MNSAFLGVVIGLVLVFAIVAGLTSTVTEAVARFMGLRAEYLLRGLRTLVAEKSEFGLWTRRREPATGASPKSAVLLSILEHPLVQANGNHGSFRSEAGNARLSRKERRELPSYLSSETFVIALVDAVVPDASGRTNLTEVRQAAAKVGDARLRAALETLCDHAEGDITRFRQLVENWYDEHMARVSGWYKRHVRWISLAVALVFVLLFNLSAIRVGTALYLNEPLRSAVVAEAGKAAPCALQDPRACLDQVRGEIAPLEQVGLPLGWTPTIACAAAVCSWPTRYGLVERGQDAGHNAIHLAVALLGYAIMVVAALPGARFWFDMLSRLNSLRETGPKPAPSQSDSG